MSVVSVAPFARAEEPDITQLPIEKLMQVPVVTVTKQPSTIEAAPGIVSVITRDEISMWGYRSVAEALAHVPGFYGIDDLVSTNFGVRGVNAGQRGYNRIIKVLVNGQPTTFRPDGTNLLGLEFIPIGTVERIEVVRGPASALYGANAYLGVVNVVTRTPAPDKHGEVTVSGQYGTKAGGGGQFLVQHAGDNWGALGAVGYGYFDRSGHELPASSPRADQFADKTSANDIARPLSAFLAVEVRPSTATRIQLQSLYSRLDTFAEFIDFGTLTHANRIVQHSIVNRAKFDVQVLEWLQSTASVAFSAGGPAGQESLSEGSQTTRPRRDFRYRAVDFVLESTAKFGRHSFMVGADYSRDAEKPLTAITESTVTGARSTPLGDLPEVDFHNIGIYGQALSNPFESLPGFGLSAKVRFDHHNVYGDVVNYHAGISQQFGPLVTAKLLAGTSYQAPNAYHLYAQPLYAGDVVGNPALRPETATTTEAQLLVRAHPTLLLSANGYLTRTRDRVELVSVGVSNLQPQNTGTARSIGIELEARWAPGHHRVTAIAEGQKTEEQSVDPFVGDISAPSASYPRFLSELGWAYQSVIGTFGVRGRYVSARRASRSNILQKNAPYLFDPYVLCAAVWSYEWPNARVEVRADNVLGSKYSEPGYNGIDLPGRKRDVLASFTWLF